MLTQEQHGLQVHLHDHPCLIYETLDELADTFVSYLRAGLTLGERCVYFIDENSREFVVEAMQAGGFELDRYIENEAFLVISTKDAHLKDGYFEEQKMLAYWANAAQQAKDGGFTGLRAAVEMTWALSGQPGCDILVPYESRLNNFASINSVSVVCQYHRRKFTAAQLKGVIQAHPVVILHNERLENAGFVSPSLFVEGSAELEVQGMLDNLTLIDRLQKRTAELSVARDEAVRANHLKSQFVANISHEIRTPMNGILGTTELVVQMEGLDPEVRTLIGTAHQSAKNLMIVVNDLLDFSKLESGKTEVKETEFFVASVVDEVFEIMMSVARKKGVTLAAEIDETLACQPLIGDVHLITQCLLNLVHNAVKFTPQGTIHVRVDSVGAHADSLTLKFCVTDNGIGIEESKKPLLFQPFVQGDGSTTRKYGGTGLGLAISSGYVVLMQGKIGFSSEEHKGSTFWFSVPVKVGHPC